MSSIQKIMDALAYTVYAEPPIGAGFGPRTTIDPAHPAVAGDDHITIIPVMAGGVSRICQKGVLTFRDGTAEEELPIAAVSDDGTVVTFDFNQVGYSGLQHDHAGNAPVSSHVYGWEPDDLAAMLNTGDSVFMAAPRSKGLPISTNHGSWPTYHIELQCVRKLGRVGAQPMNPNMWAKRTQQAAWIDLDAISSAILGNSKLVGIDGPTIDKFAQVNSSGDVIKWDLVKYAVEKDVWVYFYAADLVVTGRRENIG